MLRSAMVTLLVAVAGGALGLAPARGQDAPAPMLYKHIVAADLAQQGKVAAVEATYDLVTIRGAQGTTPPEVKQLTGHGGRPIVFLYRRGTAVGAQDQAQLEAQHPSWLARTAKGDVITSQATGSVIDITNPDVRRWLVAGIVADVTSGGYRGVYLDVLGVYFAPNFYSARPVIGGAPVSDAAWRDASIALVRETKAATTVPVVANGFGLQSGMNYQDHRGDADMLIAATDGIQIEQFTRTGKQPLTRHRSLTAWQADIGLVQKVGAAGKLVLVNTRLRSTTGRADVPADGSLHFAEASFLLAATGRSYFQFDAAGTDAADAAMAADFRSLGAPLGPATSAGSVVTRQFAHGAVAVNPTNRPQSVTLGGGAVSVDAFGAVIRVGATVRTNPPTGASGTVGPTGGGTNGGSTSTKRVVIATVAGVGAALGLYVIIRRLRIAR